VGQSYHLNEIDAGQLIPSRFSFEGSEYLLATLSLIDKPMGAP
jgi:hypothetical protein